MIDRDRVNADVERIRRFWSGENPSPLISVFSCTSYRQKPDEEAMVSEALAAIAADARSNPDEVGVVLPTFIPDFGTVSVPALWGGKVVPASGGGGIFIEPIFSSADQLERLGPACEYERSDFSRAGKLYRRVRERLESDQIFVRTPDLQGPLNTLGMLLEQTELLTALYEAPEAVHRALTIVTDAIITMVKRFRADVGADRLVGNVWPWISMVDGRGIGITQDFMPLLGPDLYREFELPQLKRIADAFGGVFIHCCGEYRQHLPALAKADFKILGIEAHYPATKLWEVHDALGDELLYVPYVLTNVANEFPSVVEFLDEIERHGKGKLPKLWICTDGTWLTVEQRVRLGAWWKSHR